jgi:hypothetical protein
VVAYTWMVLHGVWVDDLGRIRSLFQDFVLTIGSLTAAVLVLADPRARLALGRGFVVLLYVIGAMWVVTALYWAAAGVGTGQITTIPVGTWARGRCTSRSPSATRRGLWRLCRGPRPRPVPAPARRHRSRRVRPAAGRPGGDGARGVGGVLRARARPGGQADLQRDLPRRTLRRHGRRAARDHRAALGRPRHREAGRHQPDLRRRRQRPAVRAAGDRGPARPAPAAAPPARGARPGRASARCASRPCSRAPAPGAPAPQASEALSACSSELLAPSGSTSTSSPAPSLPGDPS